MKEYQPVPSFAKVSEITFYSFIPMCMVHKSTFIDCAPFHLLFV